MSAKYLLPCSCGREVAVEPTQAGEKVQCDCGNQLDVPSMREIVRLKSAEAERDASPRRPGWGFRNGLLLFGVLLAASSGIAALFLYANRVTPSNLDNLGPVQAWQVWEELRRGVDGALFRDQEAYHQQAKFFYITLTGLALAGALGIVCVVVALTLGGRRQSPPDIAPPSSVSPSAETGPPERQAES